jgi:hypothetical protein
MPCNQLSPVKLVFDRKIWWTLREDNLLADGFPTSHIRESVFRGRVAAVQGILVEITGI